MFLLYSNFFWVSKKMIILNLVITHNCNVFIISSASLTISSYLLPPSFWKCNSNSSILPRSAIHGSHLSFHRHPLYDLFSLLIKLEFHLQTGYHTCVYFPARFDFSVLPHKSLQIHLSLTYLHQWIRAGQERGKKPLPHYIICTDLFHCKLTIYFTWASDACYFLEMEWFLEMVFLVYWLSQFSYLSSNLKYLPHHPQSHLKESSLASNPHLYLSAASASFSLTLNMCYYCFSLDRASLPICVMDHILFSCRRSFC